MSTSSPPWPLSSPLSRNHTASDLYNHHNQRLSLWSPLIGIWLGVFRQFLPLLCILYWSRVATAICSSPLWPPLSPHSLKYSGDRSHYRRLHHSCSISPCWPCITTINAIHIPINTPVIVSYQPRSQSPPWPHSPPSPPHVHDNIHVQQASHEHVSITISAIKCYSSTCTSLNVVDPWPNPWLIHNILDVPKIMFPSHKHTWCDMHFLSLPQFGWYHLWFPSVPPAASPSTSFAPCPSHSP